MPLEIGVFDHLDRGGLPLPELYESRLRAIERYDEHGFFAYHVAEHHGTMLGMAPSPGIFLASAAQRTTRLRLGAMVYVLPAYDPLRLLEEICMLDNLSGGRLEIGFGRGASPYELAFFDVTTMQSRSVYDEACAVILAGLGADALTFSGKHFSYDAVPMVLQPLQRPHPPLWHGLVRANGVAFPATLRMNVVVNGPSRFVRPLTDAYRTEWRAQHGDDAVPKIGVARHIVVADTDAAAIDLARQAYANWYASNDSLWRANGARSIHFPATFDEAMQLGVVIAGSPDTVRSTVTRDIDDCGATYLMGRFAFGAIPLDRLIHSIDLFGTEVMPVLKSSAGTIQQTTHAV
jgi:alkanesulfonate monooxygenase SsuD/methylene tetrahydromethanopterin reductase-like flavin-dependent oxidoreductase (luciferase family)